MSEEAELNEPTVKRTTYTNKVHRALVREAKQKGWLPIIYKTSGGRRIGWIVEDTGKVYTLRLVGDCVNKRLTQKERGFVESLATWQHIQREIRKVQDQKRKEYDLETLQTACST